MSTTRSLFESDPAAQPRQWVRVGPARDKGGAIVGRCDSGHVLRAAGAARGRAASESTRAICERCGDAYGLQATLF